jgi:hypothetical protein
MVSGDICEPPPPPLAPVEAGELEKESNGPAGLPALDCEEDDFEEVSDFKASIADDAAPRASNMTEPQQRRALRPLVHACSSASAMPAQKPQ